MANSSIWPHSDNDPFQQQKHVEQQSNLNDLSSSSSWQDTGSTQQNQIPKWILQTNEEQIDQQKAIRAMESKLNSIKRQNYSAVTPMNYDNNDRLSINDQENDGVDGDYGPAVEDQEGLSLLWQQRYTDDGLEEALLHQKKDRQYLSSLPTAWLAWCICCGHSPID